ncbi:MAG: T9SS type A sorting domain-containing protein [Candidatus Cloacimonetes bacterium]|nr:T9SS type A sorting domain-containing protein [Candidatus Cloacimonadota bacterium]
MKKYFTLLMVLIYTATLCSAILEVSKDGIYQVHSKKYFFSSQSNPILLPSGEKKIDLNEKKHIEKSAISETIAVPPPNFNEQNAGNKSNPFQINNLANLRWLSESQDFWGSVTFHNDRAYINNSYYFIQTSNIDASETISWHNGLGFSPIGLNEINHFTGKYDGNGYSINNLHINRPTNDNVALFGYTIMSIFENINLVNVDIKGFNTVGALSGYALLPTINNSYISGIIVANDWIGGIVGAASGNVNRRGFITNCSSSVNITGHGEITLGLVGGTGGIAGSIFEIEIIYCSFEGTIYDIRGTGGIVGLKMFGLVENCFTFGNIISEDNVGGIAGLALGGLINKSKSSGMVTGNEYVGGLIGEAFHFGEEVIENSFSSCNVIGNYNVGGLIGLLETGTNIINSYFFGDIEVTGIDNSAGGLVGTLNGGNIRYCYVTSRNHFVNSQGLVGNVGDNSSVRNSFLDIETTGTTDLFGQIGTNTFIVNNFGVSTNEMKEQSTYTSNDWNFNDIWSMNSNTNEGYPYHQSNSTNFFYPPRNLTYVTNTNSITLTWDAPIDGGTEILEKYLIYRDDVMIDFTLVGSQTFIDSNVINDVEYTYYVTAVYTDPNGESVPSNSVTVKILPVDFLPPQNLIANTDNDVVNLSWEEPIFDGFTIFDSYKIYRDEIFIDNTDALFFIDDNIEYKVEYTYYVTAFYTNPNGESIPSNSVTVKIIVTNIDETILPTQTELVGNYPNPFNPETTLHFKLANNSRIVIEVFNIRGQIVKSLVDEYFSAGDYKVHWNGTDDMERSVTSGIYFYRMKTDDIVQTKRMLLLK